MHNSLQLVHLFSRFPWFNDTGNRYRLSWRSHPVLHKNMQRFLDNQNNPSEDRCARYFLQLLQDAIVPEHSHDLIYAQKHLTAYLCTSSYIVARSLQQKYQKIEFFQHRYDERDYLQIAIQYANDPCKLLGGFDFQRRHKDGKLYFVKTFAKAVLERKVKDELYKYNQESILGKYKDWGILRYDTTFKELKLALQSHIDETKIEQYLFVWHCFKEICKPDRKRSDRASPPPNFQELQDLAHLYQNHYLSLASSEAIIKEQKIEQMLQTCIKAMQNHRKLKLYYPDGVLNIENDRDRWDEVFMNRNEWIENIPLNSIAREEEQDEIATLVQASFESLSSENKTFLMLWQGLNLNQTQIGLVIDLPQYTVSRRLKKARQLMLKEFSQRIQKHFSDRNLNSDTIECVKEQMEEVLAKQSRNFFKSLLPEFDCTISSYLPISGDRSDPMLKIQFSQSISQRLNLNSKNLSKVADDLDTFLQENIN